MCKAGGFKSEAQKAAERFEKPVKLMNWDDFVGLFLEVYDKLDNEIKAKVPIDVVKVLRDPKTKPDGEE
jgi:predicted Mrr-cat superfamily restriction endonuclease